MHAVVDTGPLVAFFDRAERNHGWVVERIEELEAPLLVCEPVLTETMYLLGRYPLAQEALFELLEFTNFVGTIRCLPQFGVFRRFCAILLGREH